MSKLSTEEAIKILEDMKVDIPVPKAAVTQIKRNIALDMAVDALSSCSESPNSWIPCTPETMPEENYWLGGPGRQFSGKVLVSVLNSSDEDAWVDASQTIDGEWVLELPRYCKILAWKPMPEPYNPESKESE